MKFGLKIGIAFILGFLSGGTLGYFLCQKKNAKPEFEECTEEEQLAYAIMDEVKNENDKPDEQKPNQEPLQSLKAINTQKTNYMQFWKDEAGGKYDIHGDLPEGENPVVTEDVESLPDEIEIPELPDDYEEHETVEIDLQDVERSSLEEFYHWSSIRDGEYDTDSLSWYAGDGVLVDNEDEVIKYPVSYLGFDPQIEFDRQPSDDDDPDALYIKNNKFKTIYEIIRYKSSYNVMKRMQEAGGDDL